MKKQKHFFLAVLVMFGLTQMALSPATVTKIINNGPDADKKIIAVLGDGYAAEDQAAYNSDVDELLIKGVFGKDFFLENHNGFNLYRINLISAESGVSQRQYNENGTPSDPSDDTIVSTTMKNTALKIIYSGSWAHCWLENSSNTNTLIQNALNTYVPNYDYVVIILNESGFGGCGGGGRQIVTNSGSWTVMAHEFGHGIGGLWDEYFVTGRGDWPGSSVNNRNCSTVLSRSDVFWNRFINPVTPIPTTSTGGIDSNQTVGQFEGCGTYPTGIYRPVNNCRMRGNSPNFCPVCYTLMKKAQYSYVKHNFANAVTGDFNGDGRSDILIHNGQDIAIYRTSDTSHTLDLVWIANNIVPAAPGGNTWQPAAEDRYYVGDFDGDGNDDVFVFNGTNWNKPYLGLLRSDGTGLQCSARYDGAVPSFWAMRPGDTFFVGDFNGDQKADLYIFNGSNWSIPYLGLLKSNGLSLSGIRRYDGSIPGWTMKPKDQYFVGDFNSDGKSDLYVFNSHNWSNKYLGMLRSTGTDLSNIKLFNGSLPSWSMNTNDQFFVGDFDGDGKSDLYVFNGSDWAYAYLLMVKSTGTNLQYVKRYDSGSSAANIPGWAMRKGDRFFISDANHDGRSDLFVYNPAVNWATEYLGTLISSGNSTSPLTGSWSADWIGGWNLGAADKILVADYESAGGKADIFIRNNEWFGLIRFQAPYPPLRSPKFVMDRIYHKWIFTALYDSEPWAASLMP